MSQCFTETKMMTSSPRIPSLGFLDLTYRCNNNCRHCWCKHPIHEQQIQEELSFEQIKRIVSEAKQTGCRSWFICGGEPMLRQDFPEIFDFITRNSLSYWLLTNGMFITPAIAQLMKRRGRNLVSLYGATKQVHDHITRNPGSFEATIRGIALLKEAGVRFEVQLMLMRDNFHQYHKMRKLAISLGGLYRTGAPWLYLCASGDERRNREIRRQRLSPEEVTTLIFPSFQDMPVDSEIDICRYRNGKYSLLAECIQVKKEFHIDPYGLMSFCPLIQDTSLRYDLKKGNFQEGWFSFLPSLVDKVKSTQEYRASCGKCGAWQNCHWCPAYSYLEKRRFGAKISYLCKITAVWSKRFKYWLRRHRRYYQLAGITIRVDSELPFSAHTFVPALEVFRVQKPLGKEMVTLRHRFGQFDLEKIDLGTILYKGPFWEAYKKGNNWLYVARERSGRQRRILSLSVFDRAHAYGIIYHKSPDCFLRGYRRSLAVMLKDAVYLALFLAQRSGYFFHACAASFEGKGCLFLGHSGSGKSTMAELLKRNARVLGDELIVAMKGSEGISLYGTWKLSSSPGVSVKPAPLNAIFLLKKSKENRISLARDKREVVKRVLGCVMRPLTNVEWWEQSLAFVENIIQEIPCYELRFDRSGAIVQKLREHFREGDKHA